MKHVLRSHHGAPELLSDLDSLATFVYKSSSTLSVQWAMSWICTKLARCGTTRVMYAAWKDLYAHILFRHHYRRWDSVDTIHMQHWRRPKWHVSAPGMHWTRLHQWKIGFSHVSSRDYVGGRAQLVKLLDHSKGQAYACGTWSWRLSEHTWM